MQRLVDDLLRLARADGTGGGAGDGTGHAGGDTAVRLDLVVAGEVSRARADAPVAIDATDLAPVPVAADEAELRRIAANVLDNATRHARSHVVVAVRAGDGTAELTVTDDGPGIPADQAERIFERFARLDDARSSADGGAGLGLAIAREIAERHGGTLTVDVGHRDGARFVLRLPAVARGRGDVGA